MTKIEKQMIVIVSILVILCVSSMYYTLKRLEPLSKDIEKNGIKPYIMQLWEGKKN
jgi:hypothetical protein